MIVEYVSLVDECKNRIEYMIGFLLSKILSFGICEETIPWGSMEECNEPLSIIEKNI